MNSMEKSFDLGVETDENLLRSWIVVWLTLSPFLLRVCNILVNEFIKVVSQ